MTKQDSPKSEAQGHVDPSVVQKIEAQLNERGSYVRLQRLMYYIRLNILAVAISTGVSTYFLFHYVEFLAPIKYPLKNFFDSIVPGLIFYAIVPCL